LQKKTRLKSPIKNSVKRATLSQGCLAWHSGNVTTAVYQPMFFLDIARRFRLAKKRAQFDAFV